MIAHHWIKKCVVLVSLVVTASACSGSQTEQQQGPYSNELLNTLSNHPPQGDPVPGSAAASTEGAGSGESTGATEPPPPSEPDVVVVDVTPPPVMDAAPEASVDAGRRRTPAPAARDGGARPAPRRDSGR
ncbi:MAG: hypothetical protein JNK05_12725 [Myxococcales bacterium]|nr:hypothetical protein [Myxococcales bacterium]